MRVPAWLRNWLHARYCCECSPGEHDSWLWSAELMPADGGDTVPEFARLTDA